MLGYLLLPAVLLAVVSLVEAQQLSTNLSLQVAPAKDIACDQGPNSPTLPQMAAAAGFTHCALNADFTKVGGAFSDPAKFIDGCGATGNRIFQAYYAYSATQVPCNRMTIEKDQGIQVLHLRYLHGDSASTGMGARPLELAYPTLHHGGAVNSGWPQPTGPEGSRALR